MVRNLASTCQTKFRRRVQSRTLAGSITRDSTCRGGREGEKKKGATFFTFSYKKDATQRNINGGIKNHPWRLFKIKVQRSRRIWKQTRVVWGRMTGKKTNNRCRSLPPEQVNTHSNVRMKGGKAIGRTDRS